MIGVSDLELKSDGFDSWPSIFQVTTSGKLFTHMLHHQAVLFSTGHRAVKPYG